MKKMTITVALAIALVVVVLLPDSVRATNHTETEVTPGEALFVVLFLSMIGLVVLIGVLIQKTSVIMVQVAVSDPSELQRDLFIISKLADATRNRKLKFLMSETVSRLLRHPDCFCSANSLVDVIWMVKRSWKKSFDRICDEESKQFDGSNVKSFDRICDEESKQFDGSNVTLRGARSCNDFVVVTILVAVCGVHKLPEINSHINLEKALAYLKSIPPSDIHTMKVFWTPEDGHKKLLKKDIDEHFPMLRPLRYIEGIQWS